MEKLKPLIIHRFWILSAPAILLPLIAWWVASANVTELINKREADLNAAFGSIPPADTPNDTWTAGLSAINKSIERQNEESANFLWQSQERLMFWPDNIKNMMANVPYRGAPPLSARDLFRSSYFTTWNNVFQTVQPFDMGTGQGLVLFDESVAPQIDRDLWEVQPPTSEEMWDAQEDVWLLKAMLESIHRVNANSSRVTESPIRSVEVLEFRGGSRASTTSSGTAGAAGAAGAGGGAGAGTLMPDTKAGGPMANRGGGGMATGASNAGGAKPADFPPEDEFGSEVGSTGGGGGAAAAGGAGGGVAGGVMASNPAGGGAMAGERGGASGEQKPLRYVDDDKNMPFKTRGFYLQVVMEIRHVPELMVELTNNPYPVRIVRVQQADLMMDNVDTGGGFGSRSGGGRGQPGIGGGGRGAPMAAGKMGGGRSAATSRGPQSGRTMTRNSRPGAGGIGNITDAADYQAMAGAALSDPDLCTVAIAGLMTIYRPVEAKEATPGTSPAPNGPLAQGNDLPASDEAPADEAASEDEFSEGVSESEPVEGEMDEAASDDNESEPAESAPEESTTDEPATDEPAADETETDEPEAESSDEKTEPASESET